MKTFKKLRKSLIAFLLAAITAFPAAACADEASVGYAKVEDVEFWGTYAAESILQDLHGVYDEFKFEPTIDLTVLKGEEEADKIIMTTGEKPIKEFDVSITDLKSGSNTLSKDNIDIYQVLYTYLGSKEFYLYQGYYPDGLAPISGTKAQKENNVAANSNQGIYVSFNIPNDQEPGTYTGTMVITIGEEAKNIPVTIQVVDAEVPVERTFRSSFSIHWGHQRGELDNSARMRWNYIQALADHRLGPSSLGDQFSHGTQEDVDYLVRTAIKYCEGDNAVNFGYGAALSTTNTEKLEVVYSDGKVVTIPTEKDIASGKTTQSIYNQETIDKYFSAMFYGILDYWAETGKKVNTFERMSCKGVDEPELHNNVPNVPYLAYSYQTGVMAVYNKILADESIPAEQRNDPFFQELLESMKKVPHVVTSTTQLDYYEDGGNYDPEVMWMTFCPHYNKSGSADARENYKSANLQHEMWWYGCDVPSAPYPSYHLGNHALSVRIAGWMAADYEIVANLNWATEYYKTANGDGTNYMENYYDQAVRSRSKPGEGWLFYPGKKYGVDGPIPTMRLKEFKNGIEEWELVYKLKALYKAKGFSEQKIMNTLYSTMYDTARIYDTISCEIVENAREKLINLLLLAESEANVMITDFSDIRGKVFYNVYVKDGYTLGSGEEDDVKVSDKFVVTSAPADGGSIYTIECKDEDAVTISFKDSNGIVKGVSFALESGAAVFTPASQLYSTESILPDDTTGEAEDMELGLVKGTDVFAEEEMEGLEYLQIKMGAAKPLKSGLPGQQSFLIKDALVTALDNTVSKLQLEVYYDGNDELPILFTYKGKTRLGAGVEGTLKKGLNRITIEGMKSLSWSSIGTIEYLLVRYGEKGATANDKVYLVGITVYK
ncbi:MAG: DUF4091 domain-containing protein [Clostridiales bacterium]|nr:DUF4091 domain-containing protein [Clostridiales bacterium]